MDPWLFRRISVRFLADGQAIDIIGRVLFRDRDHVRLMRRDGRADTVPMAAIIAAREVPDSTRRILPAERTSLAKLLPIIERGHPLQSGDLRVLVRDLGDTPHDPVASSISETPPSDWWQIQEAWGNVTPEMSVSSPEVRGFLLAPQVLAARVVVAGDWATMDALAIVDTENEQDTVNAALQTGWAWAAARGAVHAWALASSDDGAAMTALSDAGFTETGQHTFV